MSFFDDLKTLHAHRAFLPSVLSPSACIHPMFRSMFSETSIINSYPNEWQLVRQVLFGKMEAYSPLDAVSMTPDVGRQEERWFFVNGICTDLTLAMLNAKALSAVLGKHFYILHNPTRGVVVDLAECVFERTFNYYAPITLQLFAFVAGAIQDRRPVRIVAHSQGGIIVSNLLSLMRQRGIAPRDMEVYTFASAADQENHLVGVYQEHFGNDEDFVARIGLMGRPDKLTGKLYTRKSVGHLLNRDYLEAFAYGHYCNGQSRLYQYASDKKQMTGDFLTAPKVI